MATYTFETMSQSDANLFTATDFLLFASGTVANLGVSDTPGATTTTALGTTITDETITLTENGKSLIFSADALATGSQGSPNHIVFGNNDVAVFGTHGNDGVAGITTTAIDINSTAGHSAVLFGFGGNDHLAAGAGNDTVNGGEGNDTINGSSSGTDSHGNFIENDFLLGGNGNDTIIGGVGNDHIYGNIAVGAAGTNDGNDSLSGGAGNDYINGNAGNDIIDGGAGNDRLYGGSGNDVIHTGTGNDYVNGNKGNDTITADAGGGNDTLHGGQGNDTITVTDGHNQLWGEMGNDSLVGGTGNDTINGGVGYDTMTGTTTTGSHTTFVFATGDADLAQFGTAATAANHDQTDVITNFAGTTAADHDILSLGFSVTAVDYASGGTATNFANADDAYTYAKAILAGHGTEVAALQVGGDTYLFWDSTHSTGTVDSVVDLQGVAASDIVKGDFG